MGIACLLRTFQPMVILGFTKNLHVLHFNRKTTFNSRIFQKKLGKILVYRIEYFLREIELSFQTMNVGILQ